MNFFNKILAGIYDNVRYKNSHSFSGLTLFVAKLMVSILIVIFGYIIIVMAGKFDDVNLPDSRLVSFAVLLIFYPVVDFFSVKKEVIIEFVDRSDLEDLKKYFSYYRYCLLILIVILMVVVFVFR